MFQLVFASYFEQAFSVRYINVIYFENFWPCLGLKVYFKEHLIVFQKLSVCEYQVISRPNCYFQTPSYHSIFASWKTMCPN